MKTINHNIICVLFGRRPKEWIKFNYERPYKEKQYLYYILSLFMRWNGAENIIDIMWAQMHLRTLFRNITCALNKSLCRVTLAVWHVCAIQRASVHKTFIRVGCVAILPFSNLSPAPTKPQKMDYIAGKLRIGTLVH